MRKIPNSRKFTIQLDISSLETIEQFARAQGLARNELIRAALSKFAATLRSRANSGLAKGPTMENVIDSATDFNV